MGTRISVRLWHEDADLGEAAVRAAIDEIARIERLMSTYMETVASLRSTVRPTWVRYLQGGSCTGSSSVP